jgi:hypothetical protein
MLRLRICTPTPCNTRCLTTHGKASGTAVAYWSLIPPNTRDHTGPSLYLECTPNTYPALWNALLHTLSSLDREWPRGAARDAVWRAAVRAWLIRLNAIEDAC